MTQTGDPPTGPDDGDPETSVGLAALVEKSRAEAALTALRSEGVYDDERGVQAHDADRVALPVTGRPVETTVDRLVRVSLPTRGHDLESMLRDRGWGGDRLRQVPSSWAVIGSVLLIDLDGVPDPADVGEALLDLHDVADTVLDWRGARGPERRPDVRVVAGTGDTETVHVEHGTSYALDLSAVMFSPGNKAERARMGQVVEADEQILDMFAGIGYFALPMARAGANVIAVERNPTAYRYLVENAVLNDVENRLTAYLSDCRQVEATADRVVLGHFDAHRYLDVALAAVEPGGILHVHAATPEAELPDRPINRMAAAAAKADRSLEDVTLRDVKGYSPGVRHVVVDVTVA